MLQSTRHQIFSARSLMRGICALCLLLLLWIASALPLPAQTNKAAAPTKKPSGFPKLEPGALLTVRTTAYNHKEADHVKYGDRNALGGTLRYSDGKEKELAANESGSIRVLEPSVGSAAADWSRYPVGTRFMIIRTGQIFEVDDYGIALTGTQTLDLYKPSLEAMKAWGAPHERIRILQVGSFARSLALLERSGNRPYIVAMRRDLGPRVEAEKKALAHGGAATPRPDSTNTSLGSGEGTYTGPRPPRMPPPLPPSAYTRNKPGPPSSSNRPR